MPAADSANAVETACERVRFHSVTRVIGRTAAVGADEMGRQRAGADHDEMRGIRRATDSAPQAPRRRRCARRSAPRRPSPPASRRYRRTSARSCPSTAGLPRLALSGKR